MPTDLVMLLVTAVLAVTALVAAAVAVRAARRSVHVERPEAEPQLPAVAPERLPRAAVVPLDTVLDDQGPDRPLAPRAVEGRVVVPPTGQQVVGAALSRPHVRLAIVLHGLTYALRPESRDRITALMRREYRRRRRERLAAARRAVRAAHPVPTDAWTTQPWMSELTPGPRPGSEVES